MVDHYPTHEQKKADQGFPILEPNFLEVWQNGFLYCGVLFDNLGKVGSKLSS